MFFLLKIPGPSRLMNSLDNIGLYSAERMAAPVTMKPVITRSVCKCVFILKNCN